MANPITWRNTAAPELADIFNVSAKTASSGLGGLSSMFANAANKMDTDELNNALNQIQQLNQVGQAQKAQGTGFIDSLNLSSPEMVGKARKALADQVLNNRSTLQSQQTFDDSQLARGERDTIGSYQRALAERNLGEAEGLLGSLSKNTQGRLAGSLSDAKTAENQRNFLNTAFSKIQQIPELNATAMQLRNDMPHFAEDIVINNGKLEAKEGGALSQEMLDKLIAQRYPDARTNAPTPKQMSLELLQEGANNDISPQQIMGLQGLLANVTGVDPVLVQEQKDLNEQKALNLALNDINLEEQLSVPTDPLLTPLENMSREDIYAEFKPLTEKAEGVFNWGKGDYEDFTKTADSQIDKGWKDSRGTKRDYDPRVIQLALQGTSAVRRAKLDGNLGDTGFTGLFTGDNLNKTEFKTLLDTIQMQYNNNNALNASKTEAKRQAARNRIANEG